MSFREFLDGFRAARAGQSGQTEFRESPWAQPRDEPRWHEAPRGPAWRDSNTAGSATEAQRLRALISARDAELAESKSVVAALMRDLEVRTAALASLRAENNRLRAELTQKPARTPRPPDVSAENFARALKLARRAAARVHPDAAGTDKGLAAALEYMFKELRATIDSMEGSA